MAADGKATLLDLQREQIGQLANRAATVGQALAALGNEMVRFAAARVGDDIETQHALLTCQSLSEVQRLQVNFWQQAAHQYASEFATLIHLSGNVIAVAVGNEMKPHDGPRAGTRSDGRLAGSRQKRSENNVSVTTSQTMDGT